MFERIQFLSFGAMFCRAPESDTLQSIANEYLEQYHVVMATQQVASISRCDRMRRVRESCNEQFCLCQLLVHQEIPLLILCSNE